MANIRLRLIGAVAGGGFGALVSILGAEWLQPPRPFILTIFFAVVGAIIGLIVAMNVELSRENRSDRGGR